MGEPTPAYSETVSDRAILRRARALRAVGLILEGLLWLIVAGSVLAIGSVHHWAYVPLWWACGLAGVILSIRGWLAWWLRRRLGRRPFAFHLSGRWLIMEPSPAYPDQGWHFDLRRSLLPRAPLLLPGVAFAIWASLPLVPWTLWGPATLSPPDTRRGLAFVVSLLALHLAAAGAFEHREARERFRRLVAGLGFFLGFQALIQLGTGTDRIYWFFTPLERSAAIFGPFVNRNHFAGYMLMVSFVTFALLARSLRRYRRRVGEHPNARRRLVALSAPEGTRLLFAALPALAAVAALVATASRGALVAFAAGLFLAGLGLRRHGGVPVWGLALAVAATVMSWHGLERLGVRFGESAVDAPGRTLVWRDSLARMKGAWWTGTGFNTFALGMSRTDPWRLPSGATPWPAEIEAAFKAGERPGTRSLLELEHLNWYREAHNDYLQVLVETGIPGLLVALWAAAAALRAVRTDPWLMAAVASVLLHAAVDFDLQIPAIPVLLVAIVALRSDAPAS